MGNRLGKEAEKEHLSSTVVSPGVLQPGTGTRAQTWDWDKDRQRPRRLTQGVLRCHECIRPQLRSQSKGKLMAGLIRTGEHQQHSQRAESLPFHVPSAPHPPHLSQNFGSEGKAASVNGWERSRRAPTSEPAILPVSGASNLQSSHFLAPGALDRTVSH